MLYRARHKFKDKTLKRYAKIARDLDATAMQFGNPLSQLTSSTAQLVNSSSVTPTGTGPWGSVFTLTLPNTSYRTLVVQVNCFGPSTVSSQQLSGLTLIGLQSNIFYYGNQIGPATGPILVAQPPYLQTVITGAGFRSYLIVIQINPLFDTSFSLGLTFTGNATPYAITVNADQLAYDESVYYNGTAQPANQTQTGVGAATIITGPARLLTAQLWVNANTTAALAIANPTGEGTTGNFMRVDAIAGGFAFETMTFPPNTILETGAGLNLSVLAGAGAGFGAITYAYP